MHYYEIYVASPRFHGQGALTYSCDRELIPGSVVQVPLQRQTVLGIVRNTVRKPRFATKPISKTVLDHALPSQALPLIDWLQSYYPSPVGFLTQLFLPSTLMQQSRKPGIKTSPQDGSALPPLTQEQQAAIDLYEHSPQRSLLLHGDTGTGKTRTYLEIARRTLDHGRSVLVMTPEIGLTPQLAADFEATFPGRVVIVHSTLTAAERRNAWLYIATATEPLVVLGPRSALFSPLHNIGAIVLDEVHDAAYKQEQAPYYQASRVAARLAELHEAKLVLGSATPLVSDYYAFTAKRLPIARMQQTAKGAVTPASVEVIDLRERDQFTRSSWLSTRLIQGLQDALQNQTQSLVFLNRRGTARLVMCHVCGWQAACPRCDLPLTYHGDNHTLRCHTCGFSEHAPAACPSCNSTDIVFRSVGTKTLVSELERLFPHARVQRFDSDTSKADSLEQQYESVRDGSVDILVGTQMLSKGLDLPKLSTVGVVVADTSLYFPDYTAEERTFQMLTQVMGRVGRGHQQSTIIIQTYHPDSPTIQHAIHKNYAAFYETQIKERELFHFPPYYFVLKLSTSKASQKSARVAAEKLVAQLQAQNRPLEIIGPAPAFIEKTNNQYRWQVVVKARRRTELTDLIPMLPAGWTYDLDPSNLL